MEQKLSMQNLLRSSAPQERDACKKYALHQTKGFWTMLLLVLLCGTSSSVAQTYQTIALTGFNEDCIASGTSTELIGFGIDLQSAAFMAQDFNEFGVTPSFYLPESGLLSSASLPGLTYQLGSYADNNALQLTPYYGEGTSGTLNFTTPVTASTVYVLGCGANGPQTTNFTINFTDGSSQTGGSYTFPDWFTGSGYEYLVGEGINIASEDTFGDGTFPGLYAATLLISPSNLGKSISSIYVWVNGGDSYNSVVNIFAVSVQVCGVVGTTSVCAGGDSTMLYEAVSGGTWSSSATSIATINASGVVTSVSAGTTVISYNSAMCNDTATVTVLAVPPAINGTFTLCGGSTTSLSDTGSGGIWSSDSASIASIDPGTGIVSGIGAGIAIISFTAAGCSATQTVTVNGGPISGASAVVLGHTILLSDGTGGTWSSSNTSVATVGTDGTVIGVAYGSATITYALASCGDYFTTIDVTPPIYCIPEYALSSDDSMYGIEIKPFNVSGTGGSAIDDTESTDGTGYMNRTILTVTFAPDSTYVATLGEGTYYGSYLPLNSQTWIDFDGDGIFEPSETVGGVNNYAAATTNYAIAIPEGIANGMYTMRVAVAFHPASPSYPSVDPCSTTYLLGETRDYTVQILGPCTTTVTVAAVPAICAGDTATLTATGASTYNWYPATGLSCSTCASPLADPLSTTVYTVTGTTSGCSDTTTVTVTVNPTPTSTGATNSGAVCSGNSVTLYDNSANATGWSWTGSDGSGATSESPVMTPTVTTTYSLTLTNSDGCGNATIYTTTVSVNAVPASTGATNSGPVCSGNSVTLYANSTNATGWSWTGSDGSGATSESPVMTPSVTTTYSLTLTNSDGCGNATVYTTTVTVNAVPASTGATNSGPVCSGNSVTLYANSTNATGWLWTGSDGSGATSESPVMTPTATTTYSLTLTNSDGCGNATVYTTTVVVNTVSSAGTVSGASSVNVGLNITLTDATGGGTWSSNSTSVATVMSGVVYGVAAGTATISYGVTSSCGTTYATKVITVNSGSISGISGSDQVCSGGTITLSNATGGGTWSMESLVATIAASTGVVTASSSYTGTATVTYTAGSMQTTVVITVNPNPTPIQTAATECAGSTTSLTDATGGGTWSATGDGTASGSGVAGTLVAGAGAGSVTISYTLPTGCASTASRTIYANPLPISGIFNLCVGAITTLSDASSGVNWSSSDTAVAKASGGSITGVRAGTAMITYESNTAGYCTVTQVVTVSALPAAISGNTGAICPGLTLSLTDGAGIWSSSSTAIAIVSSAGGIVTGMASGTATISYQVTGTAGCIAATVVTVNTAPAITGTAATCPGGTTLLHDAATGGTWSSGAPAVATIGSAGIVSGIAPGSAVITYTTATGCVVTQTVTVNGSSAQIGGNLSLCNGTSTTLSNAGTGGTWTASNSIATVGGTTGVVTASATLTGTTTISYTSGSCVATGIVTVNSNPTPIQGTTAECAGLAISLSDATPGGSWSNSGDAAIAGTGTTAVLTANSTGGTATVTYTLSTGCIAKATNTIYSLPQPIMGNFNMCVGLVTILSDASPVSSWTSSSTAIAIASGADISGEGVGTATITFKTSSVGNCITTQVITVNAMPVVTAINGPASISHAGSPVSISDATSGGTWTSSNTSVITLSGSTGSPIGATAVTTTGSSIVTYAVTIAGCTTKVTKTFSAAAASHPDGGNTAIVNAGSTVSLGDDAVSGSWSSSDNGIATVDGNGQVAGIVPGSVTITHEITGDDGTVSTELTEVAVTAVPASISLVPNPNKGTFAVKGTLGTLADETVTIEVTDVLGQVIYKNKLTAEDGKLDTSISLGNKLINGMYMLNVQGGTENKTIHFVVEQ